MTTIEQFKKAYEAMQPSPEEKAEAARQLAMRDAEHDFIRMPSTTYATAENIAATPKGYNPIIGLSSPAQLLGLSEGRTLMDYETRNARQVAELERIEARPDDWFVALAATCIFLATTGVVAAILYRWLTLSGVNLGVN